MAGAAGRGIPAIELHLVGPLQSNKAREAVALFDAIHSRRPAEPGEALAKEIARQGRSPLLFVEINTGGEPQKAGVLPQRRGCISSRLPRDLWACDRRADVPAARRRAAGAAFRPDRQDRPPQWTESAFNGDERAISPPPSRMGATHVRIGTAIFGERG